MVWKSKILALIFCCFGITIQAFSQEQNVREADGGGNVDIESRQACMTQEFENNLELRLEENRSNLVAQGILESYSSIANRNAVTIFSWPLKQRESFDQFSYYDIQNFVDLNPGTGITDYACNSRSYNGHNGIDIDLWPYWWYMMEQEQVEVIAAAAGVIIGKDDFNSDMNCSCVGAWNAVYVEHNDGSRAYYGHLKRNSLTSKSVGSNIGQGEYIGLVGSSGCSSNPHLHLEIREMNQNVIEPFEGTCNNTVNQSWWEDQRPYRDPKLNVLYTHDAAPQFNGFCPGDEDTNFKNTFGPGNIVYTAAYYADQETGDETKYSIIDASGNIFDSWSHFSPNTYNRSFWWWSFSLPTNPDEGEWTWRAEYNGEVFDHKFNVSSTSSIEDHDILNILVFPNPSSDWLSIKLSKPSLVDIKLIDASGKTVIAQNQKGMDEIKLNISHLNAGLFFLDIKIDDSKVSILKKIIKTNKI